MTTNAMISNLLVEVAAAVVSPQTYDTLEEVIDFPSMGETAPLEDVTHFQSTSREYIGGLPDGDEFTIQCNRVHTASSTQTKMETYKALTKLFRVTETDTAVSPITTKVHTFSAVVLGWSYGPAVGSRATISYSCKITGGVTTV